MAFGRSLDRHANISVQIHGGLFPLSHRVLRRLFRCLVFIPSHPVARRDSVGGVWFRFRCLLGESSPMAGPKIGCAAWLFDSPPYTVWGRLRSVSATAPKPNQALERTDSADSVMSAFRFTFLIRAECNPFCAEASPVAQCGSLGEEVFPMNSEITPAQLSPDVLYPGAKSKALPRIIILGALIAGARSSGTVR